MSLVRSGYEQTFEELCPGNPNLGLVSLVPWDTQTFGFSVATYKVGAEELSRSEFETFGTSFSRWTTHQHVDLCSCVIPAKNKFWIAHLPHAGFTFVDFALRPSIPNLARVQLPEARYLLREAKPNDNQAIEAIASHAFRDGRYHADPWFPARLADLRYRDWVRRALQDSTGLDHVYVLEQDGEVGGFYHVTVEGTTADLRLAAVTPALQGTMVGFELYVSILHLLKGLGVRRVLTSISAANTPVMNVYSALGFRFGEPEVVFHWHSQRMRSGTVA